MKIASNLKYTYKTNSCTPSHNSSTTRPRAGSLYKNYNISSTSASKLHRLG